jgi:hypothetical protein
MKSPCTGLSANDPRVSQEQLLKDKAKFSKHKKLPDDRKNMLARKRYATKKARAKKAIIVPGGNGGKK